MLCRRLVRWIKDSFGKRELQHDLPFIVSYFEDCIEYACLAAFDFQQLSDCSSRNLPGVIGIAQLLALGIEDKFFSNAGIEIILWHDGRP
jgi:hypothetical protein